MYKVLFQIFQKDLKEKEEARKIKPNVDNKQIIYLGEVTRKQVAELFRNAKAFVNPIKWGEAFGYVMIESQSCGTPVIAFNRGSVPEIVKHGKTGFVVPEFDKNKKINQSLYGPGS